MNNRTLVPEYGPLTGVRVVITGSLIAMPHAASMMADFGAEVIAFERKDTGETYRSFPPHIKNENGRVGAAFAQDARNRLDVTFDMDLNRPEALEVFTQLIKKTDIYMENMVWIDKFGITDEWLLEQNPRLVIVHVSGFGNKNFGGVEEICNRASNDAAGQAFSGAASINGTKEKNAVMLPYTNDYITGLTAAFGALSAYIYASRTGEGQVVDVSQFESHARVLADLFVNYTENGVVKQAGSIPLQPADVFMAKDKPVALAAVGQQYFKALDIVGFDPSYFKFEEVAMGPAMHSEKGREFDLAFRAWCSDHTADEIVRKFSEKKIPCSQVNNAEDAVNNEHFNKRGDFVKYEDQTLKKDITAFGIAPKMSKTPGKVWRGAARLGQDNEEVLRHILGFDDEKIKDLQAKGLF